jgi:hypothetical protein
VPTTQSDTNAAQTVSPNNKTDEAETSALSQCQALASDASAKCNVVDDDNYTASVSEGIAAACKDLQQAGLSSGKNKTDQAKACQDAYMSCAQTCGGSAGTYSESDNWSTFNSASGACLGYASKAKAMLDAGSSSVKASTAGANCLGDSSPSPQSLGDKSAESAAAQTAAAANACAANPTGAGCTNFAAAAAGVGQFGSTDLKKANLDVADTSGLNVTSGPGNEASANKAPTVSPIANNTGGGIPGGGGGGKANAGGGGGGILSRLASAITDIEKGFLGGGGAAAPPPPPGTEAEDPNSLYSALTPAGRALAGQRTADLKRYLPGGDMWQGMRGPATTHEFHGPGVDLWSRITLRMQEKCKLGELIDCK